MNWQNFKTYDLGQKTAFEALNNQLFERYLKRTYQDRLQRFQVINGSGGDGGIEAYGLIHGGEVIAVQSKFFLQALDRGEIKQIRKSILTALDVRPNISEYIICVPKNLSSVKFTKGNKLSVNDEEAKVRAMVNEIAKLYPELTITWWFDSELLNQIQQPDNEGVHKYWFDRQVFSFRFLEENFAMRKENEWLKERYIPDLHSAGIIDFQYQRMTFSDATRAEIIDKLKDSVRLIGSAGSAASDFLKTAEYDKQIGEELKAIIDNLMVFENQMVSMQVAASLCNTRYRHDPVKEYPIFPTLEKIEIMKQTNRQKDIVPRLTDLLRRLHQYLLPDFLQRMNQEFNLPIKLVAGNAGSGKTHGLANCVSRHLACGEPALIIQAKGTPCASWTNVLSHSLELPGWTKEDIFSALETLCIINDNKLATLAADQGKSLHYSTALICIDGLEEESDKQSDWCSRIAETVLLAQKYPRIRFLFSARDYFPNHCIDRSIPVYEYVSLPLDGDVEVGQVKDAYFSYYQVVVENNQSIRGLNTLLSLKLFCEEYQGRTIKNGEQAVTAVRDLINLKVKRVNAEFVSSLQQKKGDTKKPVAEALTHIAELFYDTTEISHKTLQTELSDKLGTSLSANEVDLLLDFLVRQVILVRSISVDRSDVLDRQVVTYRITYQTIIEHLLAEKIYNDIKSDKLTAIPEILHRGLAAPPGTKYNFLATPPNEQIIQYIVNRLFGESGRLIGDDDYLTKGLAPTTVTRFRYKALADAPYALAIRYKNEIDKLCWENPMTQYYVLKYLVLPSSRRSDTAFGSKYVHEVLKAKKSAFERDKIWSGLDSEQANGLQQNFRNNVRSVFAEFEVAYVSEYDDHDQGPLLHTWALSNIDQEFRANVRNAIARWAKKRPDEFCKLLDLFSLCNDPQIMEDLSSIALGLASRLVDKELITPIAQWGLRNIFSDTDKHRNAVVRQGFRAAVERAYQLGGVSEEELAAARPVIKPLPSKLLPVGKSKVKGAGDEAYPIENDLAWYVIKKAYDDFLEYPQTRAKGYLDQDCKQAKALLELYRIKYQLPLYAHGWAMAVAIGYIRRTLGLTRKDGNSYTDATHGSKSKVFTYEEKYTWLAVHYLIGYLSDYIPGKRYGNRKWITDYSMVLDMPNPFDNITDYELLDNVSSSNNRFIVKEDLAPSVQLDGDLNQNIADYVTVKPVIDFSKWLHFESSDIHDLNGERKWLALQQDTTLEDATGIGNARLEASATLIPALKLESLKKKVREQSDHIRFIGSLDRLQAHPDTEIYSNPSDIVWMDWVREEGSTESVFLDSRNCNLHLAVTKINQRTVDGEKYYTLPSKIIRKMIGAESYHDLGLFNRDGEKVAFTYEATRDDFRDSQDILLVDEEKLEKALSAKKMKMVWWVELYKSKNALNEQYKHYNHIQRCFKYLVWREGQSFESILFWEERFSNQRDEVRNKRRNPFQTES